MPNLRVIQAEVAEWSEKNFGVQSPDRPFKGMVEELGELAHALLKQEQGIRGTKEELEDKAKDAVGDLLVYTLDFCSKKGWDAEEILDITWAEVRKRQWDANPDTKANESQTSST